MKPETRSKNLKYGKLRQVGQWHALQKSRS